jgi:preprotein translocase subunit SecG
VFFNGLLNVLLVITSVFLILLVLIQRGKGGGLAGAFGGVGGSSAFGTKAGDVFTRITIYTALVWFGLNMLLVYRMNQRAPSAYTDDRPKAAGKKSPARPEPGPADVGGTKAPLGGPAPTDSKGR